MVGKKKAAPKKTAKVDTYRVFEISQDLGTVNGHADPVDAINAIWPGPVASGQFVVVDNTGSVEFVDLVERSSITPEIKLPEDLF